MTHKAVFFGEEVEIRHVVSFYPNYYHRKNPYDKPFINKTFDETTRREIKLHVCDFDNPPFKINEIVFIEDLEITTRVKKVVRSTSGEYLYYTDYLKELETQKTIESKVSAEKRFKEKMHDYKCAEEELKEERKQREKENSEPNKKWYQFWK